MKNIIAKLHYFDQNSVPTSFFILVLEPSNSDSIITQKQLDVAEQLKSRRRNSRKKRNHQRPNLEIRKIILRCAQRKSSDFIVELLQRVSGWRRFQLSLVFLWTKSLAARCARLFRCATCASELFLQLF